MQGKRQLMRMASVSNSNLHADGKCLSLNKWTLRSEDKGFVYADLPKATVMSAPPEMYLKVGQFHYSKVNIFCHCLTDAAGAAALVSSAGAANRIISAYFICYRVSRPTALAFPCCLTSGQFSLVLARWTLRPAAQIDTLKGI